MQPQSLHTVLCSDFGKIIIVLVLRKWLFDFGELFQEYACTPVRVFTCGGTRCLASSFSTLFPEAEAPAEPRDQQVSSCSLPQRRPASAFCVVGQHHGYSASPHVGLIALNCSQHICKANILSTEPFPQPLVQQI